jgi:hypothetical protein
MCFSKLEKTDAIALFWAAEFISHLGFVLENQFLASFLLGFSNEFLFVS